MCAIKSHIPNSADAGNAPQATVGRTVRLPSRFNGATRKNNAPMFVVIYVRLAALMPRTLCSWERNVGKEIWYSAMFLSTINVVFDIHRHKFQNPNSSSPEKL